MEIFLMCDNISYLYSPILIARLSCIKRDEFLQTFSSQTRKIEKSNKETKQQQK